MAVRCPSCGRQWTEKDLGGGRAPRPLCPGCRSPLERAASTLPFRDPAALRTLETGSSRGGKVPEGKNYCLVILSGKEPGKVIPLEKTRVTIGRTHCDINLDDGEVSRQHAVVQIHGDGASLEDLGSSNGTYLAETRVVRASLEDRSEFRVGSHELMFVVTERDANLG